MKVNSLLKIILNSKNYIKNFEAADITFNLT